MSIPDKQFMTNFINLYREHTCLWKVKSKEYKDTNLKRRAYNSLLMLCRQVNPEANEKFVKSRIQNLRNAFRKEVKKIKDSKMKGTNYKPTLWYYDLISFTAQQEITPNKLDHTYNTHKEEEHILTPEVYQPLESGTDSTRQQLPTNSNAPETSPVLPNREQEFEAIGFTWASKLRRMDQTQRILAENLIHRVITKGLLLRLNDDAEIADNLLNISEFNDINQLLQGFNQVDVNNMFIPVVNQEDLDRSIEPFQLTAGNIIFENC